MHVAGEQVAEPAVLDGLPHLAMDEPEFGTDPMPRFAEAREVHPWLAKSNFGLVVHEFTAMRELFRMDDKLRPSYDGIVDTYGQLDSAYGMHPCKVQLPGVEASTGSLGHGLPLAVGMALSARHRGEDHRVVCLLGDGETGEGSVWEAAMAARSNELGNLVAFIDRNRQLMTSFAEERVVFEPYPDKWRAFGWNVIETDGHDMSKLVAAIDALPPTDSDRPTVVIAETIKGKGVDFMEHNLAWHAGSLGAADLERAMASLEANRKKETV